MTPFPDRRLMRAWLCLLLLVLALPLQAQRERGRDGDEGAPRFPADPVSMDLVVLPGDHPGQMRVDVLLRVSWNFLVFQRSTMAARDSLFSAEVEVTVEQQRPDGTTLARRHGIAQAQSRGVLETRSRDRALRFSFSFPTTPGEYRFVGDIEDRSSTRSRTLRAPLRLPPANGRMIRGDLFPLVMEREGVLTPTFLGNGWAWGSAPIAGVVMDEALASGGQTFRLSLRRAGREDSVVAQVDGPSLVLPAGWTLPRVDSTLRMVKLEPGTAGPDRIALFSFGTVDLDPGTYLWTLKGAADSASGVVSIFWHEMPRSLTDPEFALLMMRHILTEAELDSLRAVGSDDAAPVVYSWWRKAEPDPARRRVKMREYYQRVDAAIEQFRSVDVPNGALTDRGKIYILYGPPDDVRRDLDPENASMETWTYTSPPLTFRFVDRERKGRFRLIK